MMTSVDIERKRKEIMMDHEQCFYEEQAALWNGTAGRAWVDAQHILDQMFAPMTDVLLSAVAETGGARVLDVGCGTGATTLAVARRLGAAGECTGIDVSAPMIDAARIRAERERSTARFVQADAQRHRFDAQRYDTVISRIGVMFFDDPVAAFRNLRQAVRDGGALRFIAWRGADENPFMTTAERAAAPLVPALPAREPGAPGQFAFADRDHVHRILAASGWSGIDIRPVDLSCAFPASELERYLTRLGPLGRIIDRLDVYTRDRVIAVAQAAFEPYLRQVEVRFTAACWLAAAER